MGMQECSGEKDGGEREKDMQAKVRDSGEKKKR
jgi:hypothetical protein